MTFVFNVLSRVDVPCVELQGIGGGVGADPQAERKREESR